MPRIIKLEDGLTSKGKVVVKPNNILSEKVHKELTSLRQLRSEKLH